MNLCDIILALWFITGVNSEFFKCWFGEPLDLVIAKCNDNACPTGYVCVNRFNHQENPPVWNGCCPEGNGPCDIEKQKVDPEIADLTPPGCDENGFYEPKQCTYPGCFCTLPNGTNIDGTFVRFNEGFLKPEDCERMVNRVLTKAATESPNPEITTPTPVPTKCPKLSKKQKKEAKKWSGEVCTDDNMTCVSGKCNQILKKSKELFGKLCKTQDGVNYCCKLCKKKNLLG